VYAVCVHRMPAEGEAMLDYEDEWEEYDESTIWYYARKAGKRKGLGRNPTFVYISVNRKSEVRRGRNLT
jgi:hypothetical protein